MSFVDLREWIGRLEKEGELRRITAEVDWDRELGAIARRVLEKKGPALLFENIKGYQTGRCTRLLVSGLGSVGRLALALGFPKDLSNRELVQHVMKTNRQSVAPRIVATGPVKDVVIVGPDVDQTEFPVPKWHYLEGGRYIHTFSGVVTRDPETRVMNVGIYRGMIGRKNTTPFLLIKGGQHWGQHFLKYAPRRGPFFRGRLGAPPRGSYGENRVMLPARRAALAWKIPTAARIPGGRNLFVPPITNGVNVVVQIKKAYQGQPKQIAAALWGSSAAQFRYKNVIVVEEDIDPSSYEQVDWAFAHRVNAGLDGIVVFPGIFGSPIDPSTPLEDRDVAQLGTGLWNRVLIDATRSWKLERRAEWGGEHFPPTVRPAPEDEAQVRARWEELGLGDL